MLSDAYYQNVLSLQSKININITPHPPNQSQKQPNNLKLTTAKKMFGICCYVLFNILLEWFIYFIDVLILISLVNSLSLLMEVPSFENEAFDEQITASYYSANDKVAKFSFLAKILQENNPISTPEHTILRPVKVSRANDPNQCEEEASAKNILKRTIIKETTNRFGEKVRENFLMKGKMLTGSKKPLENQMHSFLLCLNERINKQVEKNQKFPELPSLSKHDIETNDSISNKKMQYQDVFKNLREVRLKKSTDVVQSPLKQDKYRQNSRNEKKQPQSQTISYNKQQNKQPVMAVETSSIIKFPLPLVKSSKDITFMKGYVAYDKDGFSFLQRYRQNMQSQYEIVPNKSRQITANAYILIDFTNLTPISGRNSNSQIQIASLTKIMTSYLCLMVCKKYNVDIYTYSTRVGDKAAETPGTTAELQNGDTLTIYELLMALMLPSGNDASVAIAEAMGKIIQRHKKKQTKKNYYETFIAHMNLLSKQLKLDQTWSNSSGLTLNPNYSSPEAIILLTAIAIRNPIFHRIVNTKSFEIDIKNQRFGLNRRMVWRNTNKLLDCGWQGVKTGTTQNAGHCLMARKDNLLIGVFDCESLSRRFSECVKLYDKYRSYTSI